MINENNGSKKRGVEVITLNDKNEEVEYWKEKCLKIQKMRDDAENDLKEIRHLKEETDQLFNQKIQLLEEKISLKSDELVSLSKPTPSTVANTTTANTTSTTCQNCEELKKQQHIYEILSGIKMKKVGEDKYVCTIKNNTTKVNLKFNISATSSDDEVEYEPITNSEIFPEYMRSSLAFEKSMGPTLLGDLLATLFPPEDENNDG